jgi:hypothetical protein
MKKGPSGDAGRPFSLAFTAPCPSRHAELVSASMRAARLERIV